MVVPMDELRRRFRARRVKVTPQRAAIYQVLVSRSDHPTAEDLYKQVKRRFPMLSPNTVYYNLGVLKEAGLVQEVNYWHDRVRFDGNVGLHHHLICLGCRKIQDLMDGGLDRLELSTQARAGFDVMGHRVEFHGYCASCRRAKKATGSRRSP